jgi:dethiobiotin synthetase
VSALLLVTGTDTGVGKTLVTAAITAALTERGRRIGIAKPVETGCRAADGRLEPVDAATLAAAARSPEPLHDLCQYQFPEPLAPALAAERAGVTIDLPNLAATLHRRATATDLLLVEGAGGLLVPLTRTATYADLAVELGAPVVVVVGSRLGAINHACLTLEALAARAIATRGYVLNRLTAGHDLAVETNGALLATVTPVPCLGGLPWIADATELLATLRSGGRHGEAARARLAELAAAFIDLDALAALD